MFQWGVWGWRGRILRHWCFQSAIRLALRDLGVRWRPVKAAIVSVALKLGRWPAGVPAITIVVIARLGVRWWSGVVAPVTVMLLGVTVGIIALLRSGRRPSVIIAAKMRRRPGVMPIPCLHVRRRPGVMPIPCLHVRRRPGVMPVPCLHVRRRPGVGATEPLQLSAFFCHPSRARASRACSHWSAMCPRLDEIRNSRHARILLEYSNTTTANNRNN